MKKQIIILVIIAGFIIIMAIGYSIFSESIDINGTVVADGVLDIEFSSIGTIKQEGYIKQATNPEHSLAAISEDRNATVINVNKLTHPGSYVEIPITITNVGTIKAFLTAINTTGLSSDSSIIKVSYLYEGEEYNNLLSTDKLIEPQASKEIDVRIEWKEDAVDSLSEETQFTITLDYNQVLN